MVLAQPGRHNLPRQEHLLRITIRALARVNGSQIGLYPWSPTRDQNRNTRFACTTHGLTRPPRIASHNSIGPAAPSNSTTTPGYFERCIYNPARRGTPDGDGHSYRKASMGSRLAAFFAG